MRTNRLIINRFAIVPVYYVECQKDITNCIVGRADHYRIVTLYVQLNICIFRVLQNKCYQFAFYDHFNNHSILIFMKNFFFKFKIHFLQILLNTAQTIESSLDRPTAT